MSWPFQNHKHRKENKEVVIIEETNVIVVEGEHYKKWNPEKEELEIIEQLVKIVDRLTQEKKQKPIFTLSTVINNQTFIMADISLVVGTNKSGAFTLLDAVDGSVLNATFSNQSLGANSNPEFATFELDASNPNQINGTPVAAGSGTLVINTHADFTDKGDGSAQSQDFSITKNFTVTVVATPHGATFDVVFS